jgi:7,8-dihydroneopterin aldolase/epimerase/oxygenase
MARTSKTHGWLEIHALRCDGRHGAYEGEKERARTFLVDITVRTDLSAAIERDSLDATIDIAQIGETARDVVGGPSRTLLERVAADVASAIVARFGSVEEVRVRIVKPEPDGLGASAEAATITLGRPARAVSPRAPMRPATPAPRSPRRARG